MPYKGIPLKRGAYNYMETMKLFIRWVIFFLEGLRPGKGRETRGESYSSGFNISCKSLFFTPILAPLRYIFLIIPTCLG